MNVDLYSASSWITSNALRNGTC